jgi:hypothetical protein
MAYIRLSRLGGIIPIAGVPVKKLQLHRAIPNNKQKGKRSACNPSFTLYIVGIC